DKLKAVLPDSWVVSQEEGQKQRDDWAATDPRNIYRPNMEALQRPQSFSPSQTITNNTTINANTNNPAALANAAGQAVGRATERAPERRWAPPNVEAPA